MTELPPKPSPADVECIDEDFWEAARYYSCLMFSSGTSETIHKELKRKLDEDEMLDPLVYILARHRTRFQGTALPKTKTCTCLTELQDDAYSPGGPMSGRPRPPACEVHSKKEV